jgi:thiol-disulfide isomerase/thioredoxin
MADKRNVRLGMIAGACVGVAWCVYLAIMGPSGARADLLPPDLKPPRGTLRADYGWTVLDLDGKTVPFDSFRGKVVFLNFWGIRCPPCVDELPAMDRLAQNPRLKNVAFVALSIDDDPAAVRRFKTQHKLAMPVYLLREIPPRVFLPPNDPDSIKTPVTFVIAADGRIATVQDGPAQWDDPAAVDFLEQLAREDRANTSPVKS